MESDMYHHRQKVEAKKECRKAIIKATGRGDDTPGGNNMEKMDAGTNIIINLTIPPLLQVTSVLVMLVGLLSYLYFNLKAMA